MKQCRFAEKGALQAFTNFLIPVFSMTGVLAGFSECLYTAPLLGTHSSSASKQETVYLV